jgi:FkbM family methyltransferase
MCQFLTTLQQIRHSDSVGSFHGVCRHLQWQMRRLFHAFPCELPISNSKLLVERPGGVAALVNAMGEYDYNNMRFVQALLRAFKGTFLDVGAHIGAYTLIASEVQDANVIAIEPHPRSFVALIDNVRKNNRYNVICLNVAASSRDTEVAFTDEAEPALNHILEQRAGTQGALHVPGRRLDTLCRAADIAPDVIKIDVEGHQHAVLEGLGHLRNAANAILIEGGEDASVMAWMRESGFAGPWFVHFNQRILSQEKQPRPEDPVFIQRTLLERAESRGNPDALDMNAIVRAAAQLTSRSEPACQ